MQIYTLLVFNDIKLTIEFIVIIKDEVSFFKVGIVLNDKINVILNRKDNLIASLTRIIIK